MKQFGNNFEIIIKEFFYVLSGSLLVFIILELIWPRIVLAYLNISLVLILWLLTAIFILLKNNDK